MDRLRFSDEVKPYRMETGERVMTLIEALEIACEELLVNVEYLRDKNKGYESLFEAECNELLTARNVLLKELWEQKKVKK